jgi:hypothetical protein
MTSRDRIIATLDRLAGDELDVLALVAERLAVGREQYGQLELASDTRDFGREALDEAADMAVYAAAGLIRDRRRADVAIPPGPARLLGEQGGRLSRLVGPERERER